MIFVLESYQPIQDQEHTKTNFKRYFARPKVSPKSLEALFKTCWTLTVGPLAQLARAHHLQ